MTCKICGGTLAAESRTYDSCRRCGMRHIAFCVNRPTGSIDQETAETCITELEAEIGRSLFDPTFHAPDNKSYQQQLIARIRALRKMVKEHAKPQRQKVTNEIRKDT